MKQCPKCGELNGDKNERCYKCNEYLGKSAVTKKICPKCLQPIMTANWIFVRNAMKD